MKAPNRGKPLLAIPLVGLLLTATAILATAAKGAEPTGENSLTIGFCDNETWQADFATAHPVAELMKVATATPHDDDDAYDYDFGAMGFEGIDLPSEPDQDDWTKTATQVASLVDGATERVTLRDSNRADGLDDGLYLLLVHDDAHPLAYGPGIGDSLIADTAGWSYSFPPVIIALPSRDIEDGAFTDWTHDVTATLKPTRSPGMGSIRIEKTIRGFDGNETILVFHVIGRDSDGNIRYDEHRPMEVQAGGSDEAHASIVIGDVPTSLLVSVTEEYPGAGYRLVDSTAPEDPTTGRGTPPVFSFVNEKTDGSKTGGGIANRFVYDEDGKHDWTWHAKG